MSFSHTVQTFRLHHTCTVQVVFKCFNSDAVFKVEFLVAPLPPPPSPVLSNDLNTYDLILLKPGLLLLSVKNKNTSVSPPQTSEQHRLKVQFSLCCFFCSYRTVTFMSPVSTGSTDCKHLSETG